jgi:hypothetical protein
MKPTDVILGPLFLAILVFNLQSCHVFDGGFRFSGHYQAARSGYRIQIVSAGYVKSGDDLAESAFAAVAFCPTGKSHGRIIRVTLTATPHQGIKLDAEEWGMVDVDINWKTSHESLTTLLHSAGYEHLVLDEVRGSVRVIMNSLSGPKGVILKGQIESLQVLHTDITYGYKLTKGDPPRTWIDLSDVPQCE